MAQHRNPQRLRRQRSHDPGPQARPRPIARTTMLSDEELLRYSRQILMPRFDIAGQEKLKAAHVLVIGAGGLGCLVALYLGAAGVGHLTLVDDDQIELANLQRQIAFQQSWLGDSKAERLAERVRAINPEITVNAVNRRVGGDDLKQLVTESTLVLDCTDNFNTRFALNRASVASEVPLVSGAAIRGEGQLSVYDPRHPESPCYHCLYPEQGNEDLTCSEARSEERRVGKECRRRCTPYH